jgi:hypothetical protein
MTVNRLTPFAWRAVSYLLSLTLLILTGISCSSGSAGANSASTQKPPNSQPVMDAKDKKGK